MTAAPVGSVPACGGSAVRFAVLCRRDRVAGVALHASSVVPAGQDSGGNRPAAGGINLLVDRGPSARRRRSNRAADASAPGGGRLEARPQTPRKGHHVSRHPRSPLRQRTLCPDGRGRRAHHPAARHALRAHGRTGQPVDVGPRRPPGRPDGLRRPRRRQRPRPRSRSPRSRAHNWRSGPPATASRDAEALGISQSRFQALGAGGVAGRHGQRCGLRHRARHRPGSRPRWPRERSWSAPASPRTWSSGRQPRLGGRHRT